jgi:ribulose-5-phosphate 4-epimerase/fuculose-1-phosphate aldolase
VARRDEGVIKYACIHRRGEPPEPRTIEALNAWRNRCFDLGLVGAYPDGIGYGNLSCRIAKTTTFWITGSATGAIPRLLPCHYTRVLETSPQTNQVVCDGPIQASSESMTHGALYSALPDVGAVIHVHSRRLWEALLYRVPTTGEDVLYGTPEMCAAVEALARMPGAALGGVLVAAGHVEGLFVFGATLDEAGGRLLELVGA